MSDRLVLHGNASLARKIKDSLFAHQCNPSFKNPYDTYVSKKSNKTAFINQLFDHVSLFLKDKMIIY